MNAVAGLPRIVRFFPSSYAPDSTCPHCGARGALVHRFEVEGGARMGAMSGCVQLFPVAPVAAADLKLQTKEREYARRGFNMPSWDREKREAIDAFYAGTLDERATLDRVRAAESKAKAFRTRRGWR